MSRRLSELPTRHIGILRAICDRRRKADLREDLEVKRYLRLGIKERLLGEAPYKVCRACIHMVREGFRRV